MEEFKSSLLELRKEFSTFIKEHYKEIQDIWIKITEIETKQKLVIAVIAFSSSIIGGVVALLLKSLIK